MALVLSPTRPDHGEKLDAFLRNDEARNDYVNHLARENVALHAKIAELEADHEAALLGRRQYQKELLQTTASLKALSDEVRSHETVLVILDGDGAVFLDELYEQGRVGGRVAATTLQHCIKQALRDRLPDHDSTHWHIIVHLVLNERGLAKTLQQCGTIASADLLKDFGHGWVSLPNFFWTDTGAGKERADCRAIQLLHFHMADPSCKKLFFGPCSDTGYCPQLERYCSDPSLSQKITLIEARPAESAFKSLGLSILPMGEVFREDNLTERRPRDSPRARYVPIAAATAVASLPARGQRPTPPSPSASLLLVALRDAVTPAGSDPRPDTSQQRAQDIYYDSLDRRLDAELPAPTAGAEARFDQRVHAGKMCNAFHLLGRCDSPIAAHCDYQHGPTLPADEMLVLQHKARGLPCRIGAHCRDHACISGHRCKYGTQCVNKGCRFPQAMHSVAVRRAKVLRPGGTILENV